MQSGSVNLNDREQGRRVKNRSSLGLVLIILLVVVGKLGHKLRGETLPEGGKVSGKWGKTQRLGIDGGNLC